MSTEELVLTNFDLLVGVDFLYIRGSYYFEKQTDKDISSWRLNLFLDEEIIFELTTANPFSKYTHTVWMESQLMHK